MTSISDFKNVDETRPIIPFLISKNFTERDDREIIETLLRCLPQTSLKIIEMHEAHIKIDIKDHPTYVFASSPYGSSVFFSTKDGYYQSTNRNIKKITLNDAVSHVVSGIKRIELTSGKRNIRYFKIGWWSSQEGFSIYDSNPDNTIAVHSPNSKESYYSDSKGEKRLGIPYKSFNGTGPNDFTVETFGLGNLLLFRVPYIDDRKHGIEERWFFCGNEPGFHRYWLNGIEVSREEYSSQLKSQIQGITPMIPDLTKITSGYLLK